IDWKKAGLFALLTAPLLTIGTGCGALSAAANPKLAWAIGDPAPMTVVVRRADAAENTSKEVDRLLTATPADGSSDWMKKTAIDKADAAAKMKELTEFSLYKDSKARVVPSEVWVKELVVLKNDKGQYPNVLSAVDKDLGDNYAKIMVKNQEVATANASIKETEIAMDEKGVTEVQKTEMKKKIKELEATADKAEDAVAPLKKSFLESVKTSASKSSKEVKDQFGVVVVNLHQAVEDAKIANGAAVVRFPLAIKGITSDVQKQVPVIVGDIIEEKTGKRPTLAGFTPAVTLEGGKVGITLNGLSKEDTAKLSAADLTTETIARTQRWVGHAISILATCTSTQEALNFQDDTLEALQAGFETGGWKAPAPSTVPSADGK
ncbi:MAG: hypothetical protein ABIP39_07890, partial [Polyangiaceae bacterium]